MFTQVTVNFWAHVIHYHDHAAILEYALVVLAQQFDGIVNNSWWYVWHFTVIDVETDGNLLLSNDFVAYTGVIWIHCVSLIPQTPGDWWTCGSIVSLQPLSHRWHLGTGLGVAFSLACPSTGMVHILLEQLLQGHLPYALESSWPPCPWRLLWMSG